MYKGFLGEVTIEASERPFDVAKAHLDKTLIFTELSMDEPPITTKPRGVKIPHWEDIKDDGVGHAEPNQGKAMPKSTPNVIELGESKGEAGS